jgi:hypothetical protein
MRNDIGEAGLRALCESPHTGALEGLALGNNSAAPLGVLLGSALGARLRWVSLEGGVAGVPEALAGVTLPQLRELRLGWRYRHALGPALGRLRSSMPWCAIE